MPKNTPLGADVRLLPSAASDLDNSRWLNQQWQGPFGVVPEAQPLVFLPEGVSVVTLMVSDGRRRVADSARVDVVPCFALSAQPQPAAVQLSFPPRADAERYDIYRASLAEPTAFVKVGEAAAGAASFLDGGRDNNQTYVYVVGAWTGGVGCFSSIAAARPTQQPGTGNGLPVIHSTPVTETVTGATYIYDVNATDPDGDPLAYALVDAPAGMAIDATTGLVTWVPGLAGSATVTVRVDDAASGPVSQSFEIAVRDATLNRRPQANAGPDVKAVGSAALDGSGSTDPDGDLLTYLWAIIKAPADSVPLLTDPSSVRPELMFDRPGDYILQLTVSDGEFVSSDLVMVSSQNGRPIGRAGRDRTRWVGRRIELDGSRSSDSDGDPLIYAWTLLRPDESAAKLSDASAVKPTFVIDVPGSYTARLIVKDAFGESAPDDVIITTSNSKPVARAGADRTITVGETAPFNAERSSDDDGDPLAYRWSIISRPADSTAPLSVERAMRTKLVPDKPGLYVVQLIVSDEQIMSDPDAVVVIANPIAGPNHPPVAQDDNYVLNAGRVLNVPVAGVLDNDTDADGDPLRAILVEPPGSGTLILSPAGSFTYTPSAGPNRIDGFTYKVSDGKVESAPAEVSIEVSGEEVAVSAVDTSGVITDGQTLGVSGHVRVTVENLGSRPLADLSIPFLVFEDRNNSGVFDEGDVVLGKTIFDGAVNSGTSTNVDIAVSGETQFRDAPLLVETGGGVSHRPLRTRFSPTRGSPLPAVKFTWDDPKNSDGVWSAPVVAPLIDTNGDGKIDDRDVPAIIFVTNNNPVASQEVMRLVALRGDTGEEIFAVDDPDNGGWSSQMITPAVSDLDGDGVPEVLAVSWDQSTLWAFSNDGTVKWKSDVPPTNEGNPYLVDVDGDGLAEILYGANKGGSRIYTHDGTLKTVQAADSLAFASERDNRTSRLVADLDLDGTPEIIDGPSAVTKDGEFLWGWRTVGGITQYEAQGRLDGGATKVSVITQMPLDNLTFTAVANVDDDPNPEVIAISTNISSSGPTVYNDSLWIFEHDGRIHAGPFPLIKDDTVVTQEPAHYTVFGPPAVADFDGDGKQDIALSGTLHTRDTSIDDASRFLVAMYHMDGTVAWRRDLSLEAAPNYPGFDPLSAFDFDGDGAAELVVRDPHKLYMLSGRNGSTLYQQGLSFDDGRRAGYVTIADVDNDGHADLVVPLSRRYEAGAKPRSGIVVIGDANGNWGPARGVWNQYNYHITNVEDDGSIPRRAENAGSLRLQGIRQGIEKDWAPDLTIARIEVDEKPCAAGAASLTARVGNAGNLPARSRIKVHFYDGDPLAGGALVGEAATLGTLPPGSFEDVALSCVAPPKVIFATVNSPLPVPPVPSDNLAQLPHTWAETRGLSGVGTGQAVSLHQNAFEGIDDNPRSTWNSAIARNNIDPRPPFYEVHFPYLVSPSSVTLVNSGANGFLTGTLTFSNGFSTPAAFDATGQGTVAFPEQQDVSWVRLTAQTMRGGVASVGEFIVGGMYVEPEFRIPEGEGRLANNIVACGEGIVPCGQGVNRPPAIVSVPAITALAMKPYVYDVEAIDADGDALVYTLALAPSGMVIDETSGRITWTPPVAALGEHAVMVSVEDPRGFSDDQTFTLTVAAPVVVPNVAGLPQAGAEAAIAAAQLQVGSVAIAASNSAPAGSVVGQSPAAGTEVAQSSPVDIVISGGHAPIADAGPDRVSDEAATVTLDGSASSDPDSQPLTYQWTQVTGTQVALSAASSPRPSFTAPQVYIDGELSFRLQVSNGRLTATDDVTVLVHNTINEAPTADAGDNIYVSTPQTVTLDGSLSSDPNGEPITYAWTMVAKPSASAAVLSDPTAQKPSLRADKGGQYLFELVVSDGELTSAPDRVLVNMQDGRVAPTAQIRALEALTDVGSTTTVKVVAADDVGVASVVVKVDGVDVPVDSNGYATFQTPRAGTYVAQVTVTDVGGRIKEDAITVRASERGPTVDIVSPKDGAVLTSFTDIVGTAADGTIVEYTLSVAPIDGTFTEIARGTQAVQNGVLARLDPTVLPNGSYTLRLTAVDAQGNGATVDRHIDVAGDLKLGNFRLTFEDLSIPVAGVPITVRRTYDTLEANASRDLGFGWRLDVLDARLQTSVSKTGFEGDLIFNGFRAGIGPTGQGGTRVYITRPGGKREGFIFKPTLAQGLRGSFLRIFLPEFIPDPGVKSKLAVRQTDLSINEEIGTEGKVFPYGVSSIPYNPGNPQLGGNYTYMTEDGLIYTISGLTGKTTSVRDGNDNTLTVTTDGVTSSTGDKVTFEHDSKGRITAVIDPLGHRVRYDYDARGDLVKVTDREDNTTQFVYRSDRPHYIERIVDPLDRPVARTEYDDRGRLAGLVDAAGNRVAFDHLTADHTEVVRDALGHPTTYVYDDRGNVLREIDALGGVITRTYDDNNNMRSETDPLGNTTTFTYDDRGNKRTVTDAVGQVTSYAYQTIRPGGFGFKSLFYDVLAEEIDPAGVKLTTSRDIFSGNLLSVKNNEGHILREIKYAPGGVIASESDGASMHSWTYDHSNLPIRFKDAMGSTTTLEYDNARRLVRSIDAAGHNTSLSYDGLDRQTSLAFSSGKSIQFNYTGDNPNWTKMILSNVGTFERTYDEVGRLLRLKAPDGPDLLFVRDASGKVIEEKDGGKSNVYGYDALGRLTEAFNARGAKITFDHDAAGRVVSQIDSLGRKTTFTYDAIGRPTSSVDALDRKMSFSYDPTSVTARDALGRETTIRQSLAGESSEIVYPDGSRVQVAYDGTSPPFDTDERLLDVTDEKGRKTSLSYDRFGRLSATTDPSGEKYTVLHENDNLISLIFPSGEKIVTARDAFSRPLSTTFSGEGSKSATYDASGQASSVRLPSGAQVNFDYGPSDQIIRRTSSTGEQYTYSYSPDGQLSSITGADGNTSFSYDDVGNITKLDRGGVGTAEFSYDSADQPISVKLKAAASNQAPFTTNYQYDQVGNIVAIHDPFGGTTSIVYDELNRPVERKLANGVITRYSYDSRDRIAHLEHIDSSGNIIARFNYQRSLSGEPVRIDREDGSRAEFEYEASNRVSKETYTADNGIVSSFKSYMYDSDGNRVARETGDHPLYYDYADAFKLVAAHGDQEHLYVYDADGRVSRIQRAGTEFGLSYDTRDALVAATISTGKSISYDYDALGQRIRAVTNGSTRQFLEAPQLGTGLTSTHLITDDAGEVIAGFVYSGASIAPLMIFNQTRHFFYLTDAMGTVVAITNSDGRAIAHFEYDAFGNKRDSSSSTVSAVPNAGGDFRFHGLWLEEATQLYHARAREYDPPTGRFLSRDSVALDPSRPADLHPYLFARSNPNAYADPTGRFTITEIFTAQGIQDKLQALRSVIINEVKEEIIGQVKGKAAELALQAIGQALFPDGLASVTHNFDIGTYFEEKVKSAICTETKTIKALNMFHFEVSLDWSSGDPVNNGIGHEDCLKALIGPPGSKRPDFIVSKLLPLTLVGRRSKSAYTVGDIKWSITKLYKDYVSPGNNYEQFLAIANFARKYTRYRMSVFVVYDDIELNDKRLVARLRESAMEHRVGMIIIAVRGKHTFN